jgi:hypothetical protein
MSKRLNLKAKSNKITKTINDTLIKSKLSFYMERGLTITDAAKLMGITAYKLNVLRSDPEFDAFVDSCTVKCEADNLGNIKDAGDMGQWQASSWLLERLVFRAINELDSHTRSSIYGKLRDLDVQNEVINMQQLNELTYEPKKMAQ